MNKYLHRYWIEFDPKTNNRLALGCGVTAYNLDDALQLIEEQLYPLYFKDETVPPIKSIIEDVDVSTLDHNHVHLNMGIPVNRGIWFPRMNYPL